MAQARDTQPFTVTFRVLDASLIPMAVKRVAGNRSLDSFKNFHYYLAPDAIVAPGRMHLTIDVSDDASGVVHTRRIVWYSLDIKMAATDLLIDKQHALLGDAITVRMVPGLVTEEAADAGGAKHVTFRPLPRRAARFSKFVMNLIRPNGQVVDAVVGTLVNATPPADCQRAEGEAAGAGAGCSDQSDGGEGESATYVFSWRVTRHVRAIGNSIIKFHFQPAEYAGMSSPLLDLCAIPATSRQHYRDQPRPADTGPLPDDPPQAAHTRNQRLHDAADAQPRTATAAASPAGNASAAHEEPAATAAPPGTPPESGPAAPRLGTHVPCAPLGFNVSANFRVVLQSSLAPPHSARRQPLPVPLGATISLTFKVLDRSSHTEVHPWGQDAARVFLYVFQDRSGGSGGGAGKEGGSANASGDGAHFGTPLAVVEAGAAVSGDGAGKELVPNLALAAAAAASSSGRERGEGFSVDWRVGGNTPRTRLFLRLKIQVADGADQDLLSAETEEAWQLALQVYTQFQGRTHSARAVATSAPMVTSSSPPPARRGAWVLPEAWQAATKSIAERNGRDVDPTSGAAAASLGAAIPPHLLLSASSPEQPDTPATWQPALAYAAVLGILEAAWLRCDNLLACVLAFFSSPWSYAPRAAAPSAREVVMVAVFSLHGEPPRAPATPHFEPPNNLTGAELRAAVEERVTPSARQSLLAALLPPWLANYVAPAALGGKDAEAYRLVPGLADLPVISDGRGRHQVSWALDERDTSSVGYRAVLFRWVDRQTAAASLAPRGRPASASLAGEEGGGGGARGGEEVAPDTILRLLESEGAILYRVEVAYRSGSVLRDMLAPWSRDLSLVAVYWVVPVALVLALALVLWDCLLACQWLGRMAAPLRFSLLMPLSRLVKGEAQSPRALGRAHGTDVIQKEKKRSRRRKDVAHQESSDAHHPPHHHRVHYQYTAAPPAPKAGTSPTAPLMYSWTEAGSIADAHQSVHAYLRGGGSMRKHGGSALPDGLGSGFMMSTSASESEMLVETTSHLSQTGSDSEAPSTPSRHARTRAMMMQDTQDDSASVLSSQVSDSYEAEDSDWDSRIHDVSFGSKTRAQSVSLRSTTEDDEELQRDVQAALEQSEGQDVRGLEQSQDVRGSEGETPVD